MGLRRKTAVWILLTFLLANIAMLNFEALLVEAPETIYIKADGIINPLTTSMLTLNPSASSALINIPKVPLTYAAEIIDSDQTWKGNTVISAFQNVLVKDCTLTIVDGNVTVYGNLTFQNATVVAHFMSVKYGRLEGYGYLNLYNTNVAPQLRIVGLLNATVKVYDSTVWDIESRNASKVSIVHSSFEYASVFDDSTLFLEDVFGMMTDVDKYRSSSPCPRIEIYNCSLNAVRVWGEGYTTLNIAHSTVNYLQTQGYTELTFGNMTVNGEWTHNGTLVWNRRAFDHIGNFFIEWGEKSASGILDSKGIDVIVEELEITHMSPAPIPQNLLSIEKFVIMTLHRKFEGKEVEIELYIYYTDEQVTKMAPSTLKIYGYSPDSEWQQLKITGVNETGKYVWGNLTSIQEKFSMCFAALGTPKSVEPPPTPAVTGETDWWNLALYIILASAAVIAAVVITIYVKHVKSKKEKQ
jgi:hypothetical protein